MASYRTVAFLLVALFAIATPRADAQILGFNFLNGLNVSSRLCCTPTGNCPGQGLAGVVVRLNCTTRLFGASTTISQNTTDANGFFSITIPRVRGLLLGLPIVPCVANVKLPLDSAICPALSATNGALVSAVRGVGTVVSSTLGRLQNATTIGFTLRI